MTPPIHRRRPRGFALVPALFLIVIVGALCAVGLRMTMAQQQTVISALQQARALAAARAGIDWQAYLAINSSGTCSGGTLNLAETALAGYTVVVTCTVNSFVDGSTTYYSYTIASTATTGVYGTSDFVQRVVRATFTNES